MNKDVNIKTLKINKPLKLDCGQIINNFPLAYETYGVLNEKKDNAILIFHALTGDQFVSNVNPLTKKDGWWSYAVGSDKAIDTEKYFVICANVIGGCLGSFGPSNTNPETNKVFGNYFEYHRQNRKIKNLMKLHFVSIIYVANLMNLNSKNI